MKTTNPSTALALILGLGLGVASLPAGAEEASEVSAEACDVDDSGFVSAKEASFCAGQQFGELTADEDYLTEERFGTMYTGDADLDDLFSEIDEDADERISRDEWVGWRDQEFAEAAEETEGEMARTDFDEWLGTDLPGTRGPAERSP